MVLNRACLENAAYGLHIFAQPGHNHIWLNRNLTKGDLKNMKKAFTHGKLYKLSKNMIGVFSEYLI